IDRFLSSSFESVASVVLSFSVVHSPSDERRTGGSQAVSKARHPRVAEQAAHFRTLRGGVSRL
ncbi:MAG: hypothetical protein KDN05_19225, partial [Verrucomicrobiae bacterium]|nr:hypothetical protein [Verrucomicrobiae bacterium]